MAKLHQTFMPIYIRFFHTMCWQLCRQCGEKPQLSLYFSIAISTRSQFSFMTGSQSRHSSFAVHYLFVGDKWLLRWLIIWTKNGIESKSTEKPYRANDGKSACNNQYSTDCPPPLPCFRWTLLIYIDANQMNCMLRVAPKITPTHTHTRSGNGLWTTRKRPFNVCKL